MIFHLFPVLQRSNSDILPQPSLKKAALETAVENKDMLQFTFTGNYYESLTPQKSE
jgi:hypothetical protein